MSITLDDLKSKFGTTETKEIEVKAWGGTVVIRKLTIAETNKINDLILSDATPEELENGKMKVKVSKANEANILKVSFALVQPKMKPKELESLSPEAMDGINEIIEALEAWDKPKKSQKQKEK